MILSIVIPARNEEAYIGRCLDAIEAYCPSHITKEVILVDNGSTDRTRAIAEERNGVRILQIPGKIGACRNAGANASSGDLLLFLDADVLLTQAWMQNIGPELQAMERAPFAAISGSWYRTTLNSMIERCWFEPMANGEKTHMNGGHLIVTKNLFHMVGQFSEILETGEDYEFCDRAKRAGVTVKNISGLEVIHLGYPRSLSAFFWREVWHGRGDYQSLQSFLRSPTAVGSTAALVISLVSLSLAITWHSWAFMLMGLLSLTVPAMVVVRRTFGALRPRHFVGQFGVALAYVLARGLAGVPGMSELAKRLRKK